MPVGASPEEPVRRLRAGLPRSHPRTAAERHLSSSDFFARPSSLRIPSRGSYGLAPTGITPAGLRCLVITGAGTGWVLALRGVVDRWQEGIGGARRCAAAPRGPASPTRFACA